jgi:hypothetical protein
MEELKQIGLIQFRNLIEEHFPSSDFKLCISPRWVSEKAMECGVTPGNPYISVFFRIKHDQFLLKLKENQIWRVPYDYQSL